MKAFVHLTQTLFSGLYLGLQGDGIPDPARRDEQDPA
jgi:hypothetical protein